MNAPVRTTRDLRRDIDDAHRAAGDVLCWCNMWIPADQLVDGTCGGLACLQFEAQDNAGLIP